MTHQTIASSTPKNLSKSIKSLNSLLFLEMDTFPSVSNLCCELKIIRAKNVEFLKSSRGDLFVRCFLSSGNNRRIQLNTKEIPINSHDLIWDDLFSLECLGNEESVNSLRQGNVIIELRSRKKSVLGKLGGSSKLLGRAEFPWKNAFESQNMEIQIWVPMISKNRRVNEDLKPPAVEVSMKIRVLEETKTKRVTNDKLRNRWDDNECDCMACSSCHCCSDFDVFAIGFALEAL